MRKKLALFFLIFALCTPVFAWQENFRTSSDEYQALLRLGSLSGVSFENVITPVSSIEMGRFLQRVDYGSLETEGRELYNWLKEQIASPAFIFSYGNFGVNLGVSTSFDVFSHTDSEVDVKDYNIAYKDKSALLEANVGIYLSQNVYGKISFGIRKPDNHFTYINKNTWYDFIVGDSSYSQVLPSLAYMAVGNQNLSLTVGRDRLSMGHGITGNLLFSENQDFNDFVKFSFFNRKVNYDFCLVSYAGYKYDNVYDLDYRNFYNLNPSEYEKKLSWPDFTSPQKTMLIHRATVSVVDQLALSLYEGAVFYRNLSGSFIQALNPMMIIHNTGSYYSGNTNNFFGFEANASFGKGWDIDFQLIADQIQLNSESHGDYAAPDAFGFLFNVSKTSEVKNGFLKVWLESVYNSEGLYLKEKQNNYPMYMDSTKPLYYHYLEDMISGQINFTSEDEFTYMGYPLGGDIIVVALGTDYMTDKFSLKASVLCYDKGLFGIGKNEVRYLAANVGEGPSQKTVVANLKLDSFVRKGLTVSTYLSSFNAINYQHTNENMFDIQLYLGFKADFGPLINK